MSQTRSISGVSLFDSTDSLFQRNGFFCSPAGNRARRLILCRVGGICAEGNEYRRGLMKYEREVLLVCLFSKT
jgi:hypothetical protein